MPLTTYTKTAWVNGGTPAINAANLNKVENQIYNLTEEAITPTYNAETTVTQQVTILDSLTIAGGFKTAEIAGNTTNGYDEYTKLLLYFEGTDASTTFTDQTGKTVTPSGNAQIDTAQKRWGTSSGLFDGTGDYLTVTDANNDLDIGTSDFTIESWVRFNIVGTQFIWDYDESILTPALLVVTDKFKYAVQGSPTITGTTTLVANVWYHVAIVRSSGSTKM